MRTAADLVLLTCNPFAQYLNCAQVLDTLLEQGQVTGASLEGAQQEYEQLSVRQRRQRFMLLQLDPAARPGEPRSVNEVALQFPLAGRNACMHDQHYTCASTGPPELHEAAP